MKILGEAFCEATDLEVGGLLVSCSRCGDEAHLCIALGPLFWGGGKKYWLHLGLLQLLLHRRQRNGRCLLSDVFKASPNLLGPRVEFIMERARLTEGEDCDCA